MRISVIKFFLLIITITWTLNGFSQACGFYRIKYTGQIKSEEVIIKEVRFPSREFLLKSEDEPLKRNLWVDKFQTSSIKSINRVLHYPTCSAGASAKTRISWIKKGKTFLPLLVITSRGKKIWVKLPIDKIDFHESNQRDNYLINIDFKEINI